MEWSSFRSDPAKRAVLDLGDSPARCTPELATPRAAKHPGAPSLVHNTQIPVLATNAPQKKGANNSFLRILCNEHKNEAPTDKCQIMTY